MDNLLGKYSVSKSPTSLIEEFVANMMLYHGIYVTEINFSGNGIYRVSESLQSTSGAKTDGNDLVLTTLASSAGHVKLGVYNG